MYCLLAFSFFRLDTHVMRWSDLTVGLFFSWLGFDLPPSLKMLSCARSDLRVKGRRFNGTVYVVERVHHDFDDELPDVVKEIANPIVVLVLMENEEFDVCKIHIC